MSLILGGCALLHDHEKKTDVMQSAEAALPPTWHAPLPHEGKVTDLTRWWAQFDDPLLAELVTAAQTVSPTLASAYARIADARATHIAARADYLPTLDLSATTTRSKQNQNMGTGFATTTNSFGGLLAQWELDLFGSRNAGEDAAQARLYGAEAEWHIARVSVAAEVANTYLSYRACEAQQIQARVEATASAENAQMVAASQDAGLESIANAALAQAMAAQANSAAIQQQTQCAILVKILVALTALDEPGLRQKLAASARNTLPRPAGMTVTSIPANTLAQRPDIYSAAQSVLAANAEITQLKTAVLPRITLAGNIGRGRFEVGNIINTGTSWSIGPITVTMPLYYGGQQTANLAAGRARYDEAASQYAAKLRNAIREVEEALLNLESARLRSADAQTAATAYEQIFKAVAARQQHGMANRIELADARRNLARTQRTLTDAQREHVAAWITLYRVTGGGWTPPASNAHTAATQETQP